MDAETPFKRSPANPILTRADLPFRAAGVFNPAAAEQDGQVVLLVRVETVEGYSDIHVACSDDGVTGWRIEREPILRHGIPRWSYEQWGCEDPRVVWMAEERCWYISYVAYSDVGPAIGIARSTDLRTAERISLVGDTNDKDGVLLPARFDGQYAILHRPDAGGYQHIWSAYSDDLIRWGDPHCVLREGYGPVWYAVKVGAGPPPILTQRGWLLIFHGVKEYSGSMFYRVGVALLDRERPHKVIATTPGSIFEAEAPYEVSGTAPNVVFPSGALLRGDELWMYYGAADRCTGLAVARLDDLLNLLEPVQ